MPCGAWKALGPLRVSHQPLREGVAGLDARPANLEKACQGESDAATWAKLDLELHLLSQKLRGAVWEARLAALLAGL